MNYNPRMGFGEQDYHLVKTSISKANVQKEVLRYLTNVLPSPTKTVILNNPTEVVKSIKVQLANKNLFNKSLPITDINVTATDTRMGYKIFVNAGVYTVSGGSPEVFCKTLIGNTYGQSNSLQSAVTLTLENDGYILIYSVGAEPITKVLNTLQLEMGATATAYTPYISDFSKVIVTVNNNIDYTPTTSGEVTGITAISPATNIINDSNLLFVKVVGDEYNYIS